LGHLWSQTVGEEISLPDLYLSKHPSAVSKWIGSGRIAKVEPFYYAIVFGLCCACSPTGDTKPSRQSVLEFLQRPTTLVISDVNPVGFSAVLKRPHHARGLRRIFHLPAGPYPGQL